MLMLIKLSNDYKGTGALYVNIYEIKEIRDNPTEDLIQVWIGERTETFSGRDRQLILRSIEQRGFPEQAPLAWM